GRAADGATARTAVACAAGLPSFGVTPLDPAIVGAALSALDLVHGSIGGNLGTGLIANQVDASCQSRVTAALLKCADARRRSFLKCQKAGLRDGLIVDAATLETACLGTGDQTQPDADGRIGKFCVI